MTPAPLPTAQRDHKLLERTPVPAARTLRFDAAVPQPRRPWYLLLREPPGKPN